MRSHMARWRRPVIVCSLVLLVLGAVNLTLRILTAPVEGHRIAVDRTVKQTYRTPKPAPATTMNNQYFSLPLPIGYSQRTDQTDVPGSLLTTSVLHPTSDGTSIISFDISTLPAGGVQELSTYRVRSAAPGSYKLTNQKIAREDVTISTRLDNEAGEVVVFWPHAQTVATISLASGDAIGAGDTAHNQADLQTLLAKWHWQ